MHAKAPLTPEGRRRLCERIEAGWTVAAAAESFGISRQTAHKWWRRYRELGEAGLVDHSSRPRRSPTKLDARLERRIVHARRHRRVGPARLAPQLGLPVSTVHRVLQRQGVSRLSDLDRSSGRTIRRIETSRPGELVHMDVKKMGKIPPGGGWRAHGRSQASRSSKVPRGHIFIHSVIDAYSRLAYSEVLGDETFVTVAEFWRRAVAFFDSYGIRIERVLTDNGSAYRAREFARLLAHQLITHSRTRPYHPQTNGKAERFNRTLRDEWAFARPYRSETARIRALDKWLHLYNHHRHHTAIGGTPVSRVNNLSRQNT